MKNGTWIEIRVEQGAIRQIEVGSYKTEGLVIPERNETEPFVNEAIELSKNYEKQITVLYEFVPEGYYKVVYFTDSPYGRRLPEEYDYVKVTV